MPSYACTQSACSRWAPSVWFAPRAGEWEQTSGADSVGTARSGRQALGYTPAETIQPAYSLCIQR
jgi:hypothetical protein